MFKQFDKLFGIDLGTSNTVIFEKGKGIVLNEPSVVAFDQHTGELLAAGSEAQAMIGRAPAHVDITYPLIHGVIANFDKTSTMLNYFIKKSKEDPLFFVVHKFTLRCRVALRTCKNERLKKPLFIVEPKKRLPSRSL